MLPNLSKVGLYCHKHLSKNINNAYLNIYSCEIMFLFKGNPTIRFDYKPSEQLKSFFRTEILSKTSILMKLNKNLENIVSSLWARY